MTSTPARSSSSYPLSLQSFALSTARVACQLPLAQVEERAGMLRIETQNLAAARIFVLEGKLKGPHVLELARCWQAAEPSPQLVDLSGVAFIDAAGKELLTQMLKADVKLVACGLMMKAMIEEIECAVVKESNQ